MPESIIVSIHPDFMGEYPPTDIMRYQTLARAALGELGYTAVGFSETLANYNCQTTLSRGSDAYRDIDDALALAWQRMTTQE